MSLPFPHNHDGLTSKEAAHRLKVYGRNSIEDDSPSCVLVVGLLSLLFGWRPVSVCWLFLSIVILYCYQHWWSASILVVFELMYIVFGKIHQCHDRGGRATTRKAALQPRAAVFRDSQWCEVAQADLVPGDKVKLCSGGLVPADCTVNDVSPNSSKSGMVVPQIDVDESFLFSDSLPVTVQANDGVVLNMGSTVVRGECNATVQRTGKNTHHCAMLTVTRKGSEQFKQEKNRHSRWCGGVTRFVLMFLLLVVAPFSLLLFLYIKHSNRNQGEKTASSSWNHTSQNSAQLPSWTTAFECASLLMIFVCSSLVFVDFIVEFIYFKGAQRISSEAKAIVTFHSTSIITTIERLAHVNALFTWSLGILSETKPTVLDGDNTFWFFGGLQSDKSNDAFPKSLCMNSNSHQNQAKENSRPKKQRENVEKKELLLMWATLCSRQPPSDILDAAILEATGPDLQQRIPQAYDLLSFTPYDPLLKCAEAKVRRKNSPNIHLQGEEESDVNPAAGAVMPEPYEEGIFKIRKGSPAKLAQYCRDPPPNLEELLDGLSKRGLRVVGIATTFLYEGREEWQFMGLLTMQYLPRSDALAAIKLSQSHNIHLKVHSQDTVLQNAEFFHHSRLFGTNKPEDEPAWRKAQEGTIKLLPSPKAMKINSVRNVLSDFDTSAIPFPSWAPSTADVAQYGELVARADVFVESPDNLTNMVILSLLQHCCPSNDISEPRCRPTKACCSSSSSSYSCAVTAASFSNNCFFSVVGVFRIAAAEAIDSVRIQSDLVMTEDGLGPMVRAILLARWIVHRCLGYLFYRLTATWHITLFIVFSVLCLSSPSIVWWNATNTTRTANVTSLAGSGNAFQVMFYVPLPLFIIMTVFVEVIAAGMFILFPIDGCSYSIVQLPKQRLVFPVASTLPSLVSSSQLNDGSDLAKNGSSTPCLSSSSCVILRFMFLSFWLSIVPVVSSVCLLWGVLISLASDSPDETLLAHLKLPTSLLPGQVVLLMFLKLGLTDLFTLLTVYWTNRVSINPGENMLPHTRDDWPKKKKISTIICCSMWLLAVILMLSLTCLWPKDSIVDDVPVNGACLSLPANSTSADSRRLHGGLGLVLSLYILIYTFSCFLLQFAACKLFQRMFGCTHVDVFNDSEEAFEADCAKMGGDDESHAHRDFLQTSLLLED